MSLDAVELPSPPYRPSSSANPTKFALCYNSGGIGDYIQWTSAIDYAIRSNPHIFGYIIAPHYFAELAKLWLGHHAPRFEVRESRISNFSELDYLDGVPSIIPNGDQFASANSMHLLDLGFIIYTQAPTPAAERKLPIIRGDEANVSHFNLPANYIVITPNATADNRRLNNQTVNGIVEYFIARKTSVIFLGKSEVTKNYYGLAADGINSAAGILDLRDKTTLTEAACIMAHAQLTLGLDNGLLHLASCTEAPVIWIFTTVDPALRIPPRRAGAKYAIITPPEELTCRFCQTRMRYLVGHDFKNCLYKDNACVRDLTAETITRILDTIDFVPKGTP